MYCDFCGKKSSPEIDEMLSDYEGEYFCDEECREKFGSKFDDNF